MISNNVIAVSMRRLAMVSLMVGLAACEGTTEPVTPPAAVDSDTVAVPTAEVPPQVAKAAKIALAVRASPDDAAAVLSAEGMTTADLDALMYEIASDPALSAAYEKATAE